MIALGLAVAAPAAVASRIPYTIQNVQLSLPGSADLYTLVGSFTLDTSFKIVTIADVSLIPPVATDPNYYFGNNGSDILSTAGAVNLFYGSTDLLIWADFTQITSPAVTGAVPITAINFGTKAHNHPATLDFSLSPQLLAPGDPPLDPVPESSSGLLVVTGLLLLVAAAVTRRVSPTRCPPPARSPQS